MIPFFAIADLNILEHLLKGSFTFVYTTDHTQLKHSDGAADIGISGAVVFHPNKSLKFPHFFRRPHSFVCRVKTKTLHTGDLSPSTLLEIVWWKENIVNLTLFNHLRMKSSTQRFDGFGVVHVLHSIENHIQETHLGSINTPMHEPHASRTS